MTSNPVLRVLLAEDDPDDREIFAEAMKEAYADVELAVFENGNALMTYLKEGENPHPHLILLDINMPFLNGKDCLRLLRDNLRYHRVPIAMLTTSATREDIMDTFHLGANRYITKPNSYTDIVTIFKQVFELVMEGKLLRSDLMHYVVKPVELHPSGR